MGALAVHHNNAKLGASESMRGAAMLPDTSSILMFSPVQLSYIAGLRGLRPRLPGEPFAYAELNVRQPQRLLALAACNPEGRFFGFSRDAALIAQAQSDSSKHSVTNIEWHALSLDALAQAMQNGAIMLPACDYVVHDSAGNSAPNEDYFSVATQLLSEGGLLATHYDVALDTARKTALTATLTILASEAPRDAIAPWLTLILDLALAGKPAITWADAARTAATAGNLQAFAAALGQAGMGTGTLNALANGRKAGLHLLGQGEIRHNFLELSAPAQTHTQLVAHSTHYAFELLKDLACGHEQRCDIWSKEPALRTDNIVTRFGGFNFTITAETVPAEVMLASQTLNFRGPIFSKIIKALQEMPHTIGDLLHRPEFAGMDATDIVGALHQLLAAKIAFAARASMASFKGNVTQPKWQGSYNAVYRQHTPFADCLIASISLGWPLLLPATTTLALAAFERGGAGRVLEEITTALGQWQDLPEAQLLGPLADIHSREQIAIDLAQQVTEHWLMRAITLGVFEV